MTTTRKPSTEKLKSEAYLSVELEAYQERLRQVRQTFNIHLCAIGASALVAVAGACLIALGKTTEGTVSAITGSGAGAVLGQVAQTSNKEANRKLDQLVKDVQAKRFDPAN